MLSVSFTPLQNGVNYNFYESLLRYILTIKLTAHKDYCVANYFIKEKQKSGREIGHWEDKGSVWLLSQLGFDDLTVLNNVRVRTEAVLKCITGFKSGAPCADGINISPMHYWILLKSYSALLIAIVWRSKGFDTFDHDLMISILFYVGVSLSAVLLMNSFFVRQVTVCLNDILS